jgi:hypothetical protein
MSRSIPPNNGHHQTGRVGPVGANNGSRSALARETAPSRIDFVGMPSTQMAHDCKRCRMNEVPTLNSPYMSNLQVGRMTLSCCVTFSECLELGPIRVGRHAPYVSFPSRRCMT